MDKKFGRNLILSSLAVVSMLIVSSYALKADNPIPLEDAMVVSELPSGSLSGNVLGERDENPIFFTVNVPSRFKKDISAPNIVYSVSGDTGIEVTEGQHPTIVNTGVLSLQGLTGDLLLQSGNGISINGLDISNTLSFIGSGGTSITKVGDVVTVSSSAPDYTLSGWTKVGTSVGLTTATDSVTVDTIIFGNATVANGKSIKPDTDLGSDLGSAAFRFNNLYVGNINSNSSTSTAGQATFTYEALSTALTESSVLINPTAPVANGQLLGLSVAGYQRALIDEDGDLTLGYNDAISAPASDYPLSVYGHNGTNVSFIDETGAAYFTKDIRVESISGGAELTFGRTGTSIYDASIKSGVYNGSDVVFYDGTVPRMVISNSGGLAFGSSFASIDPGDSNVIVSGNVGIGTTSPSVKLDLQVTEFGQGTILKLFNASTGQTDGTAIEFINHSAEYTSARIIGHGGDEGIVNWGKLDFQVARNNSLLTAMSINSLGNVGIGTDTPGAKLEVQSSTATSPGIIFQTTDDSTANGLTEWKNSSGTTEVKITHGETTFYTNGTTGYTRTAPIFRMGENSSTVLVLWGNAGGVAFGTSVANRTIDIGFLQTNTSYIASAPINIGSLYNASLQGTNAGYKIDLWRHTSVNNYLADQIGLTVKGAVSQTANLQEWQDNAGTVLSGVDERGILFSHGGTDPTNFFGGGSSGNTTLTGGKNNALGYQALANNTSGSYNNAFGYQALFKTTGSSNNAMGYRTMYENTSGSQNIAFGDYALRYNTSGVGNQALGLYALHYSQTGTYNVGLGIYTGGYGTGVPFTGADYNTMIGYQAGYNLNTDMDRNVYIGYQAGYDATGSDQLYIDNSSSATPLIWGDFANDVLAINGNVGIGMNTPGSKLDLSNTAPNSDSNAIITLGNRNYAPGTDKSLGSIDWYNGDTSNPAGVSAQIKALTAGSSDGGGDLVFSTRTEGAAELLTEYMRITHDGKVGIGTTTPTTGQLEIIVPTGDQKAIHIDGGTVNRINFGATGTATFSMTGVANFLQLANNGQLTISSKAGEDIFFINGATTFGLMEGATSRIGIGADTSPGGKLDIDGEADEIQLIVQAHSAQTANIQEWQDSGGTSRLNVSKDGYLIFPSGGVIQAQAGHLYIRSNVAGGIIKLNDSYNADIEMAVGGGNVSIGAVSPSYSLDVTGMMRATEGVVTYTKAGTISDVDFTETAIDGLMGVDSTNGRLYFRHGGAWHYVAQTAGFQIPEYETYVYDFGSSSFNTSSPLADGDFLIPFVEGRMSDGAVHGLYTSFNNVKDQLFADELSRILSLEQRVTALEAAGLTTNPLLSSSGSIGSIATWADNLWTFLGDVTFNGSVTLPTDTAGTITIPAGSQETYVAFTTPYDGVPVVTTSILSDSTSAPAVLGQKSSYAVTNIGIDGFTISLLDPAIVDTNFSWIAILTQ